MRNTLARPTRAYARHALWLLLAALTGTSTADPVGLETRPENLTCHAPERPVATTSVALQTAWPALDFMTVPAVDDLDHRNGPISLSQLPGDNSHWFVAERAGKIHRVPNDDTATAFTTVLDITGHFDGVDYFQQ